VDSPGEKKKKEEEKEKKKKNKKKKKKQCSNIGGRGMNWCPEVRGNGVEQVQW